MSRKCFSREQSEPDFSDAFDIRNRQSRSMVDLGRSSGTGGSSTNGVFSSIKAALRPKSRSYSSLPGTMCVFCGKVCESSDEICKACKAWRASGAMTMK